ncbi:MAG: hypothetical protein AAF628_14305 [Planctomycetota bacterium]
MRTLSLGLFAALCAGGLSAQPMTVNNPVLRNNEPWFSISTMSPTTMNFYNWGPVSPPEYTEGTIANPGAGVLAGTLSWRVITQQSNFRFGQRQVNGYTHNTIVSGETVGGVWANDYEAEVRMMSVVARPAVPGALRPDFNDILHSVAEMPVPSPGATYAVNRTFLPVTIPVTTSSPNTADVGLSLTWQGGENEWKDGSHSYLTTWSDGFTPYDTWGFRYPTPSLAFPRSAGTRVNAHLWLTYTEPEPTIALFSDWGRLGWLPPAGQTPLPGHSIATYWSDAAINGGAFGIGVRALQAPNGFAIPFFNLGAYFPAGFPILGSNLELSIVSPFIASFTPFVIQLDAAGIGGDTDFPYPLRPNPALSGQHFGFDCYVLDGSFNMLGSTQAGWIRFL